MKLQHFSPEGDTTIAALRAKTMCKFKKRNRGTGRVPFRAFSKTCLRKQDHKRSTGQFSYEAQLTPNVIRAIRTASHFKKLAVHVSMSNTQVVDGCHIFLRQRKLPGSKVVG